MTPSFALRRGAQLLLLIPLLIGTAQPSPAETPLERGTYLMQSIVACGNCHTPKNERGEELPGMELAGGFVITDTAFTVVTPNITPDAETGIGGWTDAQLIDAIRNGRHRDGQLLGPPMPFEQYRHISDADVRAIVAYLRAAKPVRNKVARNTYPFPLPPEWGPRVDRVAEVPSDDPARYGRYLATALGHCVECHTPMVNGRFQFDTHLGAGGFPFQFPFGTVYSPNITPDARTGLGAWTDDQIKAAITQGVSRSGERLLPPMPFGYYARIRAADQNALVAYLRSMRPVEQSRAARMVPKS